MAGSVISVIERAEWPYTQDYQGNKTASRTFEVIVSRDPLTGFPATPFVVTKYFGDVLGVTLWPVPNYYDLGDGVTKDLTMHISRFELEHHGPEDPCHYTVTLHYEVLKAMLNGSLNPLQEPWDIVWAYENGEKDVDWDLNEKAIRNSAGEKFDPAVKGPDIRPLLRVTRNEATFDEGVASQYMMAINADTFLGKDPGMVQIKNIGATWKLHPIFGVYWTVSYEFWETNDPKGFTAYVLDQGFNEKDPANSGKLRRIRIGKKQEEAESPKLLDGNGAYVGDNYTGDGVYQKFDVYNSLPFQPLGIDPLPTYTL